MYDTSPGSLLDYHRSMLADTVRTDTFARAIEETVRPGDTVLDLGCGTGVLACFACRAGARRVYAVESGAIIELARAVCRENGFADRVELIPGLSTRVRLPELVDVVVTETIGNTALDEGILHWVADARRRFLKPGGSLIPMRLDVMVVPIEVPEEYERVEGWTKLSWGIRFGTARTLAANNLYWARLEPEACLGEAVTLAQVDLTRVDSDSLSAVATVQATRSGVCHGLGVWFDAALTPTLALSNAPPLRTPSWSHGLLPLLAPLPVATGDRVQVTVNVRGNGALWQWGARHLPVDRDPDEAPPPPLQSTFHGEILSMTSLRKGAPDHAPALSDQGEVDRFILHQMDGIAAVAGIAERAAARFPDYFREPGEALARVRKLSRKYSR